MDQENLKNMIRLSNTGKKYPAVQLVKKDPELAALISKLVRPRDPSDNTTDKNAAYNKVNQSQLLSISENTRTRASDNESIMQLFPDIELAIQILVSSILSPKDMVKTEIIYKAKEPILPAELTLRLNTVASSHLDGHYNLTRDLPTILRESLFTTGSYIRAILPENTLDEIINGNKAISTESVSDLLKPDNSLVSLGILGNPGKEVPKVALEHFYGNSSYTEYKPELKWKDSADGTPVSLYLEVTDNYNLLKLPKVIESHRNSRLKEITGGRSWATEAEKLSATELSAVLYKNGQTASEPFISISPKSNSKRKSVGRPLVMKLPSSSVIPVFTPGDETKHIGAFLLVDADGCPITDEFNEGVGEEGLAGLANGQNANTSLSSMLLKKAERNLKNNNRTTILDGATKIYANIIENDLVDRLRNGIYGSNVAIGGNDEIYRIMLARSLAAKYTRLVFIPSSLISYYAFKYFPNGVGKSMLDDLKVLTSLRAMLLFAKVMALTKNSIAVTHVGMTLDPNDADPQKTIELAVHEIAQMRQQYFPLGINSPVDLVGWIQRAGFEFSFEGHPGLPNVKFDFENKTMQNTVPDSDLDELLRRTTYMTFGLSPEQVDNGLSSEFATTVVSNNILLSKRVMQHQSVLCPMLSADARRILSNDAIAEAEFLDVFRENKGLLEKVLTDEEREAYQENEELFLRDTLERYIENLELELPRPDITTVATQTEAFTQYTESLEKALEAWLNADFITSEIAGEVSGNIDAVKAMAKAYFLRKWMADNGFMPELNDLVTNDEDGRPTMDLYDVNKSHVEGLTRSILKYVKALSEIKKAADADIEKLGAASSETDSDDSGGDTGMDDFGGSEDTGEEEPADEEPGEEEPPAEDEEPAPKESQEEDKEPKAGSDNVGL